MSTKPVVRRFAVKPLLAAAVVFAVGISEVCAASAGKTQPVDLAQLYQSYQDHQQSSSDMPEYKKKLLISGIVLDQKSSLQGDAILSAGSPDADGELARLSAADKREGEKMKKLAVGASFKATCVLGFTMNADYLSLTSCTFR